MASLVHEFRQTTRQHFLHRMYQAGGQAFGVLFGALGAALLGAPQSLVAFSVGLSASIPLLMFVWLWVFNSGRAAIPTFVVRLTADGIEVQRFEDVRFLSWERFNVMRTTWHPFRTVRLKATRGRGLTFDYYALDREQREALFRDLREGTFRRIATGEALREQRRRVRAGSDM